MGVELVDQQGESVQVHVVVSAVLLRVCEFVYEAVGLVSPLAPLRCLADRVGRGEVEQTPGSEKRELRHAHADVCRSVGTSSISDGDLVADQLVKGFE